MALSNSISPAHPAPSSLTSDREESLKVPPVDMTLIPSAEGKLNKNLPELHITGSFFFFFSSGQSSKMWKNCQHNALPSSIREATV